MKRVTPVILVVTILLSLTVSSWCGTFDLKRSDIIDSVSLIEKISTPGDPLYAYFSPGIFKSIKDIVQIINKKVLPNASFAYDVTQLSEAKGEGNSQNLSDEKKDEVMAKNRDLLAELYSEEILPRKPDAYRQGLSLKIPIGRAEPADWLKAEVMNFLNEIICNELVINNWNNLRPFFDEKVSEKEIKLFSLELQGFTQSKIPINAIKISFNQKDSTAKIFIKGKNSHIEKELFEVSFVSTKHWRVSNVKNIKDDLLQSGYLNKNEVQK